MSVSTKQYKIRKNIYLKCIYFMSYAACIECSWIQERGQRLFNYSINSHNIITVRSSYNNFVYDFYFLLLYVNAHQLDIVMIFMFMHAALLTMKIQNFGLDGRGFVGINFCTPVLTSTRAGITTTTMCGSTGCYTWL